MGVAESKELLSDYLDEATVRKLAGEYFDKALFDTLATDDVMTRTQFLKCAKLAHSGRLHTVVRNPRAPTSKQQEKLLQIHMLNEKCAAARSRGANRVAAQCAEEAFILTKDVASCVEWMYAMHAMGTPAALMVYLLESYHKRFPNEQKFRQLLIVAKNKVKKPYEEVDDVLYPLTSAQISKIHSAVAFSKLELSKARSWSDQDWADVGARIGVRHSTDLKATVLSYKLCAYVGPTAFKSVCWRRENANGHREDRLMAKHADFLLDVVEALYPQCKWWFGKGAHQIKAELQSFDLEKLNARVTFAIWDALVELMSFLPKNDASGSTKTDKKAVTAATPEAPERRFRDDLLRKICFEDYEHRLGPEARDELMQLYQFFEVLSEYYYRQRLFDSKGVLSEEKAIKAKQKVCDYCGKDEAELLARHEPPLKRCSRCGLARYCNKECQLNHFLEHRVACVDWKDHSARRRFMRSRYKLQVKVGRSRAGLQLNPEEPLPSEIATHFLNNIEEPKPKPKPKPAS